MRQLSLRVSMLVESLVVSSHGFFFHFVLDIQTKITNILSSMFPTSLCFTVLLFFIHCFFSFHSLKLWRTFNTQVNQPVKLLSPPVLVNSTRFSLYAITEVSRKPKHTHFKYSFQNMTHRITHHIQLNKQVQATLKPSKLNKSNHGIK